MAYQKVRSEENDQNISTEIGVEIDGLKVNFPDLANTENFKIFQIYN